MATTTKGYRFYITAQPQVDAQATHAARTAHDDWRINQEATVTKVRVRGMVMWLSKLTRGDVGTLYLTAEQASTLGLCVVGFCGKPAEYVGFEGMRCGAHAKYGMSTLCTVEDCTNVSHTGFSTLCNTHITPAQREAYEARQQAARAQARIGWQRVVGAY